MNMRKLVYILAGVMLISFGAGALSLRYNDDFRFEDVRFNKINIGRQQNIKIGSGGIEVKDGNEHVSIGWDGINVDDGDEKVSIGLNGINISSSNKSKKKGSSWNLFNLGTDLELIKLEEEKLVKVNNIKEIDIVSDYIDIKITSRNTDEIKVKLLGEIEADIVPKLKINESSGRIEIAVENEKSSYTIVNSDLILEVLIPEEYEGNLTVKGESSDIDIRNININIGNFKSYSSSGDIYAENIRGKSITIESESGDLTTKSLMGRVDLETSSGDIETDNRENNADVKLESSSGDIRVMLGENLSYNVKAFSSSGDIKSEFPALIKEDFEREMEANIGKGKNTMELRTSSGDIDLVRK